MANILEIILKAKDQASGAFKSAEKGVSGFSTSLGSLRGVMSTLGIAAAATAAFQIGKESIALAQEQARVEAQLGAVLKSTGGIAGVTAEEVKSLASELQGLTNFGDEATIAGQNLLLTFTNIGKDVFPDATRTMLDMSAALGQDLKSSAIQLGKALNDPVTGVTALQRVGVSFSVEQKNMIASLVVTGDTAKAQQLILAELNREFGGSAEAAREADGGFTALSNSIGDLQEAVGAGGIAGLSGLVSTLREMVDETTGSVNALRDAAAQASLLGQAFTEATGTTDEASAAFEWFTGAAKDLIATSNPILNTLSTISENTGAIEEGLIAASHAIIEHTVGWEKLGDAYGTVVENQAPIPGQTAATGDAAAGAAGDMRDYAAATNEAARALGLLAVTQAQQEATARNAETDRLQGMANAYRTNPQLVAEQAAQEEARIASVEAAKEKEQQAEQSAKAMSSAYKSAATEMGQSFASEISGAMDRIRQDLDPNQFPDLAEMLGGGTENVDGGENVRRLMALASGTMLDNQEWAASFRAQNAGSAVMSGLFEALADGDQSAVQAEAAALIGSRSSVATIIADSIIQNTRAEMQQRDLMAEVNKIVAEAMGTGANAGGLDVVTIAADSANQAAAGVQTSFEDTQAAVGAFGEEGAAKVHEVDAAILTLNGHLERTVGLFGLATANANGLAEAGARAGVPNGATAGTDQRAALGQSNQ